jgi:hypothetical protein
LLDVLVININVVALIGEGGISMIRWVQTFNLIIMLQPSDGLFRGTKATRSSFAHLCVGGMVEEW